MKVGLMSSGRKIHELKTVEPYFADVLSGRKKFELRKNDRGFAIQDVLHLRETKDGNYTGRELVAEVVYLLEDSTFLQEGYCAMSLDLQLKLENPSYGWEKIM